MGLKSVRSAERLRESVRQERDQLPVGHVLVWFDWMQNVTLPLAHIELGDMFYGTDRMSNSVFGAYVLQNHGGERGVTTKLQSGR